MKKLLSTVALTTTLISTAQAGAILDLEVGGGMWSTGAPTGTIQTGGTEFDLTKTFDLESTSDNMYTWIVVDHLIPVVPNIRIEQTTLKSSGTNVVNFSIPGYTVNDTLDSTLDLSHTDFIAYWGVPFGTWLPFIDELDFGFGAKVFDGALDFSSVAAGDRSEALAAPLPYGYGKLRVEPPLFMGIGLEAEIKYISFSALTFNETIVKADWGITAPIPAIDIEAGVELGYRTMSLNVDASELKTDIGFSGIFFGLYGKFGI